METVYVPNEKCVVYYTGRYNNGKSRLIDLLQNTFKNYETNESQEVEKA
jgi:hypothetical protein